MFFSKIKCNFSYITVFEILAKRTSNKNSSKDEQKKENTNNRSDEQPQPLGNFDVNKMFEQMKFKPGGPIDPKVNFIKHCFKLKS